MLRNRGAVFLVFLGQFLLVSRLHGEEVEVNIKLDEEIVTYSSIAPVPELLRFKAQLKGKVGMSLAWAIEAPPGSEGSLQFRKVT